jgi:hypothetical protein
MNLFASTGMSFWLERFGHEENLNRQDAKIAKEDPVEALSNELPSLSF